MAAPTVSAPFSSSGEVCGCVPSPSAAPVAPRTGACVPACPPRVLVMSEAVNRKGYRYPLLEDGCTGCELCAKVCPDFCFEVFRAAKVDSHA